MNKETKQYKLNVKPLANEKAVVRGDKYRFTVLTDYLIRMEYQDERLEIITKSLHLYYDKKPFSAEGLYIALKERYTLGDSVWNYKDAPEDLRGTARTLDMADGAVDLEAGLMSRTGFTVWDDTGSTLLTQDGWVAPREKEAIDSYFFGYGHNYRFG